MTVTASVRIDVPNLAQGVAFYCGAFGFSKKGEPVPGVAVLEGLNVELCLLERPAGSKPSPNTRARRTFEGQLQRRATRSRSLLSALHTRGGAPIGLVR